MLGDEKENSSYDEQSAVGHVIEGGQSEGLVLG